MKKITIVGAGNLSASFIKVIELANSSVKIVKNENNISDLVDKKEFKISKSTDFNQSLILAKNKISINMLKKNHHGKKFITIPKILKKK